MKLWFSKSSWNFLFPTTLVCAHHIFSLPCGGIPNFEIFTAQKSEIFSSLFTKPKNHGISRRKCPVSLIRISPVAPRWMTKVFLCLTNMYLTLASHQKVRASFVASARGCDQPQTRCVWLYLICYLFASFQLLSSKILARVAEIWCTPPRMTC